MRLEDVDKVAAERSRELAGPYTREFVRVKVIIEGIGFTRDFELEHSHRPGMQRSVAAAQIERLVKKVRKAGFEVAVRHISEVASGAE